MAKTRILWTTAERTRIVGAALLHISRTGRRCSLLAAQVAADIPILRRKVSNDMGAWLTNELHDHTGVRVVANSQENYGRVERDKAAAAAVRLHRMLLGGHEPPAQTNPPLPEAPAAATPNAVIPPDSRLASNSPEAPVPEASAAAQLGDQLADQAVAWGVSVLTRILGHPDVRGAVAGLAAAFTGRPVEAPPFDHTAIWEPAHTERLPQGASRRKVTIVGLRGVQMEEIHRTHGQKLDVRFWSVDEAYGKLDSLLRGTNDVVMMTKFIPHSVMQKTYSRMARERIHSVNGGLSALRETLTGLEG